MKLCGAARRGRGLSAGQDRRPGRCDGGAAGGAGRQGADVRCCCRGCRRCWMPCRRAHRGRLGACFGALRVRLLLARMPGSGCRSMWSMRPYLYRRPGGPYQAPDGEEWPDNLQRFALLGWVAAHLAGRTPTRLEPAGRACARLACRHGLRLHRRPPAPTRRAPSSRCTTWPTRGCFRCMTGPCWAWPRASCRRLRAGVPRPAVFMKAGLKFADARDHRQPQLCARDRHPRVWLRPGRRDSRPRHGDVSGILNGIDDRGLEPRHRCRHRQRYDAALAGKQACRQALQAERWGWTPMRMPCCWWWSAG
jgi:starch synthase